MICQKKMRLDKLEIIGFKSFRNKTTLEFPDKFTTIVGPNGSGKSNIVDSICFVLGRSRGLRVNSMQELICNGGIGGNPCKFAKVTMYLSDRGKEKIKISREIYADGKSIYKLDGERTTRQKIIGLVGDNEYNIILQNDVTRLLDMHPTQRREIIDDLCGIKEYNRKKEKAIKELGKVEDKIAEVHVILGEKKGFLDELGREKDEALIYREIREELDQNRASIIQKDVERYQKKLGRVDEKIKSLEEEKSDKTRGVEDIRARIAGHNKSLKEINQKILSLEEEKGTSSIPALREEKIRCENRLENLRENLRSTVDNIAEGGRDLSKLSDNKKKVGSALEKAEGRLMKLEKEIRMESEKADNRGLEEKIDGSKSRIFELRSKGESLRQSDERGKREIEELKAKRSELKDTVGEMLRQEKILARKIDDKIAGNREAFKEYQRIREELPKIDDKREMLLKKLNVVNVEIAENKTKVKTLENSSGGLGSAINAIMKLKSVIQGVHGPLFQLGTISDPNYELPIQIYARSRLNYIVVEDEDVAAKCINYLRNKRIGRATFLPLNRIRFRSKKRAPQGCIGFARDFIVTDEKFKPVFNYILGDTILVDDLETAKEMGVGRWEMVTLDGDLLRISGIMSGGYLKDKKIAIKFLNTEELEEKTKNLQKKAVEVDGRYQELGIERKRMEKRLLDLEGPVQNGRNEVEKLRMEKDSLREKREAGSGRIEDLGLRIENTRNAIREGKNEIKSLERDVRVVEKKLEKLLKKRSESNWEKLEKIKDKHRDVDIEKNRLEEKADLIDKRTDEIRSELKDLKINRGGMEEEIGNLEGEYSRIEHELKNLEIESKELIEGIGSLMEERGEVEDHITDSGMTVGALERSLSEINEKINRKSVDRATAEAELSHLRSEFEQYRGVETVDKSLGELRDKIEVLERKISEFGSVNMKAIETYDKIKQEYQEIEDKLNVLKDEQQSIFNFMEKVERKKTETFRETFNIVKRHFEKIYHELSGGEGTINVDNPRDISNSGLLINASPRGKKLINMDSMSGGEKVITSAAFLLAIQQYKPSQFYIVDELDAALDSENSARLAKILRDSKAQFMLITHNDAVMKHAESAIGVSMSNGISEIVGVKLT